MIMPPRAVIRSSHERYVFVMNDNRNRAALFVAVVMAVITVVYAAMVISARSSDESPTEVIAAQQVPIDVASTIATTAVPASKSEADIRELLTQVLAPASTPGVEPTVDPAILEAVMENIREESQLTVTAAGVTLTLPRGYTLGPPETQLWEGTQEFLGPQSDFGQKDGQEFLPILRLGDSGYGTSNWFSTKKERCTTEWSDFTKATRFVDRETYIETKVYDCSGVKYIEASWQIFAGRWTAHYFAQTDRYPVELDELFKSVLVPPA